MPILFFLLWLLLAGQITWTVCLWGAAVSLGLWWFCRKVLWRGAPTAKRRDLGRYARWGRYFAALLWEMLKAGFAVMRLVYTRGREMQPRLIWFDTTLRSDRARAVLADSITLTAGTITVTAADGRLCVHALDASLAEGIETCAFQRRLEELEA